MSFVPRLNAFQRVFMCIFAAIAAVSVGVAANFPRHAPPPSHIHHLSLRSFLPMAMGPAFQSVVVT